MMGKKDFLENVTCFLMTAIKLQYFNSEFFDIEMHNIKTNIFPCRKEEDSVNVQRIHPKIPAS